MKIPYSYTISFVSEDVAKTTVTTDTLYQAKTILAEYVYPRADGFAYFDQ
jgi:hypothetical protein